LVTKKPCSALAYMMLNAITNDYITSVRKTMHSKVDESLPAGPANTWKTKGIPADVRDEISQSLNQAKSIG